MPHGQVKPPQTNLSDFGLLAINPKGGDPNLLWWFCRYYEDGFKEEFTAASDAKMPLRPMPQVTLKAAD
jgi:hypothetical protein